MTSEVLTTTPKNPMDRWTREALLSEVATKPSLNGMFRALRAVEVQLTFAECRARGQVLCKDYCISGLP